MGLIFIVVHQLLLSVVSVSEMTYSV